MHQINQYDVVNADGVTAIFFSANNGVSRVDSAKWDESSGELVLDGPEGPVVLAGAASSQHLHQAERIAIAIVNDSGDFTFEAEFCITSFE